MDGPGCFFYGYTERQGGFNGPGTDQGAMVIAGVSGLVYGNAGGRKRWRNVFMRSNAGYPISLWIPSSIYRFFFSATECIWFQHPSVLKGPWHQARLFPFVKYWNAQTSASGIRVCISGGGGDGWVRRGGMGISAVYRGLHLHLAFLRLHYAATMMASRARCCVAGVSPLQQRMKALSPSSIWPGPALLCLGDEWGRVDISLLALFEIRF
jgi:hypothetical protein